ncbi:hypothetical protein GIB67_000657 [Kingdonia uniflora]|uniref:methionine--tRNA ligase n=1 Tax=Kingdonia uniflora TaxID=39325 RepID=A0A7J7NDB7_9MAGN|nr:hypothetical protein GIB67_000657 [Kingdonia uniflora]
MAGRLIFTSQNTLFFLSPLSSLPTKTKHLKTPSLHFGPKLMRRSSMFCSCSRSEKDSGEPFVLTTPLYYVNAPPHMGSAYTTIAADTIARFQRLLGKKVIFITGTDEHGEKIATAAAATGCSPSEHCDNISQAYKMLWKDLDITYDKFIRTTDPSHEAIVKEFYSKVLASGDIYRADYEGLYCVNCEEYKVDEKELLENNCCPMHLKPCVHRKEDNYFFALSKYQNSLEEVLTVNPDFVQPSFRLNEVQSWIKSGLRDFSISRALVDWGIPVPNDTKQTIYVWFDALLGYISALSLEEKQPSLQDAIASGWPASLHLIGKDILRFHAVYWPAMLMSAGISLPKMVFGHGFLTKDGMKMGKSLGNTLEPKDLVNKFGSCAVRYFFLRQVEFGSDGDYSEDRFINTVNAHLANTIGNLLNRTLGLLKKNCASTLAVDSIIAAQGNTLKDTVETLNHRNSILLKKCKVKTEYMKLYETRERVRNKLRMIGRALRGQMVDLRIPSHPWQTLCVKSCFWELPIDGEVKTSTDGAVKGNPGRISWCHETDWNDAKKNMRQIRITTNWREANFSADDLAQRGTKLLEGKREYNEGRSQLFYKLEVPLQKYFRFCQLLCGIGVDLEPLASMFALVIWLVVVKARDHYENLSLSSACEAVLEIGNAGNLYMDERAPWSLFKQGGDASEAAAKDLVIILEAMRIIAIALSPVAPCICLKIYSQLGYSKDQFDAITWGDTKWGGLKSGQVMAQANPVFARIESGIKEEDEGKANKKVVKEKKKNPKKVVAEA